MIIRLFKARVGPIYGPTRCLSYFGVELGPLQTRDLDVTLHDHEHLVADLEFGRRIVVSEIEVPIILANIL